MEKLQKILNPKDLKVLEEKGEIEYFKYCGKEIDFSKIGKKEREELLKGDSHALIGNSLYVKDGDRYILHFDNFKKNW